MPVHRAGMLKAPIDRNPARPPGFEAYFFGPRGMPPVIENVEVLACENVPIAVQKGLAQMLGQRFQRAPVSRIVGVNRIVVEPRAKEFVIARIV